jgi:hypothetical protein
MTPANNWTLTAIFCGGQNLQSDQVGLGVDLEAVGRVDLNCGVYSGHRMNGIVSRTL